MPNFFRSLIDLFRALFRQQIPLLYQLAMRGVDMSNLGTSWVARLSRIWGAKALFAVGAIASAYAVFLFATDALSPGAPSRAHDAILKSRFSSPAPARDIVIVDIDERSLALLAPEHGRWPWPRSVLADGVQKIADSGARSILFNVLTSDPDKPNPDSDAALDFTAQALRPMAFPMLRLNPDNDATSQLKVSAIAGATTGPGQADRTVAVLLPMFGAMQDRLGVANQRTDADGVVRKYALTWSEPGFALPSLVGRTLEAGGVETAALPQQIALNWRNKTARYQRISFADLLKAPEGDARLAALKGAFVVVGVSAPGLGPTKPTSVRAVEDDNEILATAIDDAVNKTWLRVMPAWASLVINLAAIWFLITMALGTVRAHKLTKVFLLAQSGLGGITILSASYTNYLIDLSESMSFAIAVFGVIRLIQSLDDGWSRARKGYRRIDANADVEQRGDLAVISFDARDVHLGEMRTLQAEMEAIVGVSRVIRIDDLFAGQSILKRRCMWTRALLVLAQDAHQAPVQALLDAKPFRDKLLVDRHVLQRPWSPNDPAFADEIAPVVLESSARLIRRSAASQAEDPTT